MMVPLDVRKNPHNHIRSYIQPQASSNQRQLSVAAAIRSTVRAERSINVAITRDKVSPTGTSRASEQSLILTGIPPSIRPFVYDNRVIRRRRGRESKQELSQF